MNKKTHILFFIFAGTMFLPTCHAKNDVRKSKKTDVKKQQKHAAKNALVQNDYVIDHAPAELPQGSIINNNQSSLQKYGPETAYGAAFDEKECLYANALYSLTHEKYARFLEMPFKELLEKIEAIRILAKKYKTHYLALDGIFSSLIMKTNFKKWFYDW